MFAPDTSDTMDARVSVIYALPGTPSTDQATRARYAKEIINYTLFPSDGLLQEETIAGQIKTICQKQKWFAYRD